VLILEDALHRRSHHGWDSLGLPWASVGRSRVGGLDGPDCSPEVQKSRVLRASGLAWAFVGGGGLFECESRDSNPDGLPHWILSPARLPIPPLSLMSSHPQFAANPR
jgi:hypothetical protein